MTLGTPVPWNACGYNMGPPEPHSIALLDFTSVLAGDAYSGNRLIDH